MGRKRVEKNIVGDMQEGLEGGRVSGEMERGGDNAGNEEERCS